MIKEKKISVPNYKIGVEIAQYLKEKEKSIYVENKLLRYKDGKKIYNLIEENPKIEKINFKTIPVENKRVQIINEIRQLREVANNYKYISVDEDLISIFQDEFGYVECKKYSDTKEGKRWLKIFSSSENMCELEKLKSLEIFKREKEYKNVFFSYIEKNYLEHPLKEVYKSFFNEEPEYVPQALDANFHETIYVDVVTKDKMIVSKALLKYMDEKTLYIGRKENVGAKNQIIYNPEFAGYPEFETSELTVLVDGYYQEKQSLQGNIARVYCMQKGLSSNESSFYTNYKRYLKNLLYKLCIKKESVNFEERFKIDQDFYKLLVKTKKIIANFEAFLAQKQLKNIKKDAFFNQIRWDFYSIEDQTAIDIATSKNQMKEFLFKKKYCIAKYWLISEEGSINIEQEEEYPRGKKTEQTLEDDLFYWTNTNFICK